MALRHVKGKTRGESPRLKDLPQAPPTVREPSDGRDAQGRAAVGNTLALGRGWKATIRRSLGGDAEDADVRQVMAIYTALLRALPHDGPAVRQLVAAQSRHAWMATTFTDAARTAGLTTPAGLKLAEAARAHDLCAQRLSVTAFDLSTRAALATAKAGHAMPTSWFAPEPEATPDDEEPREPERQDPTT
jgi:hypothetical protein